MTSEVASDQISTFFLSCYLLDECFWLSASVRLLLNHWTQHKDALFLWFWFHLNYLKTWIPDKGKWDVCVCVGLAIRTLFIHGYLCEDADKFISSRWFIWARVDTEEQRFSSGRSTLNAWSCQDSQGKMSVCFDCVRACMCVCLVAYWTTTCIMKGSTTWQGNQKTPQHLVSSSVSQTGRQRTVELVQWNVFLHFGAKMFTFINDTSSTNIKSLHHI